MTLAVCSWLEAGIRPGHISQKEDARATAFLIAFAGYRFLCFLSETIFIEFIKVRST